MFTQESSSRATRAPRRPVHGLLLLDKPLGWSSNDALQKVKRLLNAEKAGHTGTLDPLATGVLPLCFGAATKFSQLQLDADKSYEAVACLGVTTATGDAEGAVVLERPVAVTQADLDRVVGHFIGPIWQLPPMHSALKKDGRPLYEYARAGVEVDRAARQITIHALVLALLPGSGSQRQLSLRVTCSKGTYVRTLAADLGEALGCGAHLVSLRRTATRPFTLAQCVSLEQLLAFTEAERDACLLPPDRLLDAHAVVTLGSEDAGRFLCGLRRRGHWPDGELVAVYALQSGALLGTGRVRGGDLIPTRLLSPVEINQMPARDEARAVDKNSEREHEL